MRWLFMGMVFWLSACATKLPAEDVFFISVAEACETVGNGLTAASKFKRQMAAEDIAKVDAIIPRTNSICKDRNNPPSTTQLASDGLQLIMREVLAIVAKYAAKGAMIDERSSATVGLCRLGCRDGRPGLHREDWPAGPRLRRQSGEEWAI